MQNHTLAKDIAIVVAAKLTLVIAAALFVFGPSQRPIIHATSVEARLIGTTDIHSTLREIAP